MNPSLEQKRAKAPFLKLHGTHGYGPRLGDPSRLHAGNHRDSVLDRHLVEHCAAGVIVEPPLISTAERSEQANENREPTAVEDEGGVFVP